jgi:hypothetical protein
MKGHVTNRRGVTSSGHPRDKPVAFDINGSPIFGYDTRTNSPVCYSRLANQNGKRCMSPIRMANGRCRDHRGNSPVGIMHPAFKDGRHSIVVNKFKEEILYQVNDPNYLHLKNALALNHIRMLEITERMNRGGFDEQSYELIAMAAEKLLGMLENDDILINNLAAHGAKSPLIKFAAQVEKMCKHVQKGGEERKLHKEISVAAKDRSKLVEVELKRVTMEKNYISADAALTLFVSLMKIITKHVKDRFVMRAIKDDVNKLAINPANRKALGGVMMAEESLDIETGLTAGMNDDDEPEVITMLTDDEFERALIRSSSGKSTASIVPQGFQFNVEELKHFVEHEMHPNEDIATSAKAIHDREMRKPALNEQEKAFFARGGNTSSKEEAQGAV